MILFCNDNLVADEIVIVILSARSYHEDEKSSDHI
jgi:hypothetical protein